MRTKRKRRISLTLSSDVLEEITRLAEHENISRSALIERVLLQFCKTWPGGNNTRNVAISANAGHPIARNTLFTASRKTHMPSRKCKSRQERSVRGLSPA